MSIRKIALAGCLLGAVSMGCKKSFLDINQNPNSVTEEKITSELITPNALENSGTATAVQGLFQRWMGYQSNSGSFSLVEEEVTYNITTSFGSVGAFWNAYYNTLYDFRVVETKAPAEGLPFYAGIAKTMKARLFQDLVDIYGNVPYSQAFQTDVYHTPVYDKAQDIYKDLQVVLDSAVEIFKAKAVPLNAGTVDIMFKGNAQKWIKFANTIKLRLLIRQSEVAGFDPGAELAKITANGGVLMSGETAAVNPNYENAVGKQNPYYASYGLTPTGTKASESVRANAYLINIYKSNSDPRLARVYLPAQTPTNPLDPYVGTFYGAAPNTAFGGAQTSYIGPGLAGSATQSQWITTSVESMFLYAEAVARGWFAGDPKLAYQNAVRESFIWLGVPFAVSAADEYMADNASANWEEAGASVSERVRFIVYQKYIALAGINALEAWNDYRRLGVPANPPLSVTPGRLGSDLPARLPYPIAEYVTNAANVQGEGSVNIFSSKIFWDL